MPVDGEYSKETAACAVCRDAAGRERADCDRYPEEIDPPEMLQPPLVFLRAVLTMLYETRFMPALVTTWCIEIPVLFALIRLVGRDKSLWALRIIGTGALCTALTLPYPWVVLPPYIDAAYYIMMGEMLVFLNRGIRPEPAAGAEPGVSARIFIRDEPVIVRSRVIPALNH